MKKILLDALAICLLFCLVSVAAPEKASAQSTQSVYLAGEFSDGLALVENAGYYGYINQKNELVIPIIYQYASDFHDGLAVVAVENEDYCCAPPSGVIDTTGKLVIPFTFDYIGDFGDGVAFASKGLEDCLIDTKGNVLTTMPYYDTAEPFSEGFSVVEDDGFFGHINKKGQVTTPIIYDEAYDFNDGLALVKKDDHAGYVNEKGECVVPLIYDQAHSHFFGLAAVEKNNLWGYLDTKGQIAVPLIYDQVYGHTDGFAIVEKDDRLGHINLNGLVSTPLIYDIASDYSDGLALVGKDGKYGYVNTQGQVAIALTYKNAVPFADGVANVIDQENNRLVINTKGEIISKTKGYDRTVLYSEVNRFLDWEYYLDPQQIDDLMDDPICQSAMQEAGITEPLDVYETLIMLPVIANIITDDSLNPKPITVVDKTAK